MNMKKMLWTGVACLAAATAHATELDRLKVMASDPTRAERGFTGGPARGWVAAPLVVAGTAGIARAASAAGPSATLLSAPATSMRTAGVNSSGNGSDGKRAGLKAGGGAAIGALVGFVGGAAVGWETSEKGHGGGVFGSFGFDLIQAFFFGLIGAVVGAIVGAVVGASRA